MAPPLPVNSAIIRYYRCATDSFFLDDDMRFDGVSRQRLISQP